MIKQQNKPLLKNNRTYDLNQKLTQKVNINSKNHNIYKAETLNLTMKKQSPRVKADFLHTTSRKSPFINAIIQQQNKSLVYTFTPYVFLNGVDMKSFKRYCSNDNKEILRLKNG